MSINIIVYSKLEKSILEYMLTEFKKKVLLEGFNVLELNGNFIIKKGNFKCNLGKVLELDYKKNPFIKDILKEDLGSLFLPKSYFIFNPDKYYLCDSYFLLSSFIKIISFKKYIITFNGETIFDLDFYLKKYCS